MSFHKLKGITTRHTFEKTKRAFNLLHWLTLDYIAAILTNIVRTGKRTAFKVN